MDEKAKEDGNKNNGFFGILRAAVTGQETEHVLYTGSSEPFISAT
jgi:hypothetical protein